MAALCSRCAGISGTAIACSVRSSPDGTSQRCRRRPVHHPSRMVGTGPAQVHPRLVTPSPMASRNHGRMSIKPHPGTAAAPSAPTTEPLATWRDGPAKQAVLDFVQRTCGADGSAAVPVEERVAVFDNDGTLWCEKPAPIQLFFILRRLVEMVEANPQLRERQPWKAAFEHDAGWFDAVVSAHYAGDDSGVPALAAGILGAYAGISVEDFEAQAKELLTLGRHPTLGRE